MRLTLAALEAPLRANPLRNFAMSPKDSRETQPEGRHGLYDISRLHVSEHALERFRERVANSLSPDEAAIRLLALLRNCRKLGTNAESAIAFLAIYDDQPIVLITRGGNVVTCLSLDQFETVMSDFGRHRWPRRFGRWLRKTSQGNCDPSSIKSPQPD
ncbi:hypothetical protein GC170_02390 [bacterium]|nr:hypothetical protein [bacterium]